MKGRVHRGDQRDTSRERRLDTFQRRAVVQRRERRHLAQRPQDAASMRLTSGSRPPPCTIRCAMTSGRDGQRRQRAVDRCPYPLSSSTVAPASAELGARAGVPSWNSLYLRVELPQLITSTRMAPHSAPRPVPSPRAGPRRARRRTAGAGRVRRCTAAPRARRAAPRSGTRWITSSASRKRSIPLSTTMSNGVVVVPSSCSRARGCCRGSCRR